MGACKCSRPVLVGFHVEVLPARLMFSWFSHRVHEPEVPRTYSFVLQIQNRLTRPVGPIETCGMTLELNGIRCPIIGTGGSGVVVLCGKTAVTLP